MDNSLVERRSTAEEKFNVLAKQREQKQQEINDIDTEMARLQGEWRVIDDLLKGQAELSPQSDVIDATVVDKPKGKK